MTDVVEKDAAPAPASLAEASSKRSHSIDILRAIAALMVVFYHARAEFWLGMRETYATFGFRTLRPDVWLGYASGVFSFGWLGVPIFFVLSGYCIHIGFAAKLKSSSNAKLNLANFYKRRVQRIYPVYIAALILTAVVDYLGQSEQGWSAWLGSNISTFLLNLIMAQELFVRTFGSNGVFWTLSIEFHLYLFYPVLFLVFRRYGPARALSVAAIISLATSCVYWAFDLSHVFVHATGGSPLFTSHLFLWTAGAYLAEVKIGRARAPRGVGWHIVWVCALVIGIFLQQRGVFAWSPLLLAIGAPGLIAVTIPLIERACRRDRVSVRAFYLVGVASYSLYATHVPVFRAIEEATGHYRSGSIIWPLVCSIVAVAFALLFFQLVERYTIRAPKTQAERGEGGRAQVSAPAV